MIANLSVWEVSHPENCHVIAETKRQAFNAADSDLHWDKDDFDTYSDEDSDKDWEDPNVCLAAFVAEKVSPEKPIEITFEDCPEGMEEMCEAGGGRIKLTAQEWIERYREPMVLCADRWG